MVGGSKSTVLLNLLTGFVLLATVFLVVFYGLVGINVVNPFGEPVPPTLAVFHTYTPAAQGPTQIATWTPTTTSTITPTPGPTRTRTPTLTPSITPTFPPTATPTPRVTRSAWSFTAETKMQSPQYGCSWTGVAGYVQDLDGNPLKGYPVHVWGAGIDVVVTSGADARYNTIYGNQAAWEQFFDGSPKSMQVKVQLHDPYRSDHLPISKEVMLDFPGYCSGALGFVVFTENH